MKCEFLLNKTCQIANQLAKINTFPSELDCKLCSGCREAKSENIITITLAINSIAKNNLPKNQELIDKLMNICEIEKDIVNQNIDLNKNILRVKNPYLEKFKKNKIQEDDGSFEFKL